MVFSLNIVLFLNLWFYSVYGCLLCVKQFLLVSRNIFNNIQSLRKKKNINLICHQFMTNNKLVLVFKRKMETTVEVLLNLMRERERET